MRLKDKVAIITGAGQGIGKAYARRFLDEGAKVVIAEIHPDRGKGALDELSEYGDVRLVQTDVSDTDSCQACAATTVSEFGRIDVLINNAALYYDIDNRDNSPDYLEHVFRVNLHGALFMIRAAAPTMVEQGSGRIINQSSGAAYTHVIPAMGSGTFREVSSFAYSQTKWGVLGLTKFIAGQLGRYGITVNCISPGVTMTEATKKVVPEHLLGGITFMTAMQRTLEPEDLTGAAVFFASDDAAMVTGQVLCVDGGMHMPA